VPPRALNVKEKALSRLENQGNVQSQFPLTTGSGNDYGNLQDQVHFKD